MLKIPFSRRMQLSLCENIENNEFKKLYHKICITQCIDMLFRVLTEFFNLLINLYVDKKFKLIFLNRSFADKQKKQKIFKAYFMCLHSV